MIKISKKLLVFILAAIMMQSTLLVSCSSDTGDETTKAGTESSETETSAETETETEAETEPEETYDLGAMEFNMCSPDPAAMTWANPIMDAVEITGEPMNDAIYERNRGLEKKLNIVIKETYTDDIWGPNLLRSIVTASDQSYDIVTMLDRFSLSALSEKLIVSYQELPNIDLTKNYWGGNMLKDSSIGGVNYFAFGDFSLYAMDNISTLLFNQNVASQNGINDLYDLVESKKWTYDKFSEYSALVTNDTDGDGEMTDADMWGYLAMPKQILPSFWIAGGVRSISKDENDLPVLSMDNETFHNIVGKIFEMSWDSGTWYANKIDSDNDTTLENMFIRGNSLFHDSTFQKIARLREMDADFGIIPYPMASESQDSYYTRESGALFSNVPITQENKENIGLILEKLAEESAKITTPAYKNVIMKGKYSRDNQSSQMLDLLYDTRVYDLGDSFWCDIIRDNFIKTMMTTNDRNLSSNLKKYQKIIVKTIEKVVVNITANEAK